MQKCGYCGYKMTEFQKCINMSEKQEFYVVLCKKCGYKTVNSNDDSTRKAKATWNRLNKYWNQYRG